jgi:PAS domain-containing protein
MPDTLRISRSYAQRRRTLGIGGFLAAMTSFAPAPAAAAERPALSLQELVLSAHRSIDQHEIAFFALIVGVILFAVVTAVMLLRTRARTARLETWSRHEFTRLRDELDRANAVILSEPQVIVDWPAGSDEPGIDGDLSALGVSASHRVLAFGSWLDASKASAMDRAVDALRARGEAFSITLTTLAGHPIEAQGRAIGGRAVLRLKDASGIKRELVDLVGRYQRQSTELAALRALTENLPSPVWTRDTAGQLTYVNAAYTRAVEAKNAVDAVERRQELLDGAAREAIAQAQARGGSYAGRLRAVAAGARRTFEVFDFSTAPVSAWTSPKWNRCRARSRVLPTRIAVRWTSSRPASPCSASITG